MSLSPQEIVESSCEEIIPVNPFPFKSNRISRSMRLFHYLIFFPFYVEYKRCKHLYTFNMETLEWSSVEFKGSPEILENSDNYAILSYLENRHVLFGCYKSLKTGQTNNLFSRSQETPQCVLGFIWTKLSSIQIMGLLNFLILIIEGQLALKWQELSTSQSIYLEKFSAVRDNCQLELSIFGGYDEKGNFSNELYRINLSKFLKSSLHLISTIDSGKVETVDFPGEVDLMPARANHTAYYDQFDDYILILGGEDQHSNEMSDIWKIQLNNISKSSQRGYTRWQRQTVSRRPKLGTPCVPVSNFLAYIGKSTTEVIAPIRSYLCFEEFLKEPKYHTQTFSSKKHLPFDGVPHTLERFKDKLLIGYESSLYTIRIRKNLFWKTIIDVWKEKENMAWSVDDNFGIKPFDSDDVSLVKRRQKASFKDHIRQYFIERPDPDIAFRVQGEEITAHRGILSVRSKYFHELFTNETCKDKDLKNPIEVEDLTPAAFTILLEWLYCNSIKEMKGESAMELFKVADKYGVPKLKEEAVETLVKNLTLDNVVKYAEFAIELNIKDLKSAVTKFAAKETEKFKEGEQCDLILSSVIEKLSKSGE